MMIRMIRPCGLLNMEAKKELNLRRPFRFDFCDWAIFVIGESNVGSCFIEWGLCLFRCEPSSPEKFEIGASIAIFEDRR